MSGQMPDTVTLQWGTHGQVSAAAAGKCGSADVQGSAACTRHVNPLRPRAQPPRSMLVHHTRAGSAAAGQQRVRLPARLAHRFSSRLVHSSQWNTLSAPDWNLTPIKYRCLAGGRVLERSTAAQQAAAGGKAEQAGVHGNTGTVPQHQLLGVVAVRG